MLARSDASLEGIAELKRVLQRPLKTLTVNAERFAAELAQAKLTPVADPDHAGVLSGTCHDACARGVRESTDTSVCSTAGFTV